ncbi:hypothetical protein ES703_39926 [subsurface metagenome]
MDGFAVEGKIIHFLTRAEYNELTNKYRIFPELHNVKEVEETIKKIVKKRPHNVYISRIVGLSIKDEELFAIMRKEFNL